LQRRGDGFARRFAAPQHELEHGVEALALLDRGLGDGFGLLKAQPLVLARIENGRMAKDDQAGARPHFEMAEPQLLVDQAQRLVDRGPFLDRYLDVGESEELQDLVLGPPNAAQLVLRPAAGRGRDDLAFGRAFASPPARLEILLEDFDRSAVVALLLDFFLAQDAAPGFGLAARFGAAPPALASSAATRAFKA
jgi:hypothetical protein